MALWTLALGSQLSSLLAVQYRLIDDNVYERFIHGLYQPTLIFSLCLDSILFAAADTLFDWLY